VGIFGKAAACKHLCAVFDEEGWLYSGGDSGLIYVWNDKCEVVKTIKAHAEPVTSIIYSQGKLISGSKESKIAIITNAGGNFKLEKTVDLGYMALKYPKSIDFFNNNLLLGLRNGSIMEVKNVLDEKSETKILTHSHYEGETWGLTVFENKFATSGGDN